MYSLFDKFLSNSLSLKDEETLLFLLEDSKNKKAFEAYLKDQRDTFTALQEPDLMEAYNKIRGFSEKHKEQSFQFLNLDWFKFVAILFISLYMSNGFYTDLNKAFSFVPIKEQNLNPVEKTFKTHISFNLYKQQNKTH